SSPATRAGSRRCSPATSSRSTGCARRPWRRGDLPLPGRTCYPERITLRNVPSGRAPMSLDPYSPCPCGSGKKFKWCCQPIYASINHATELIANGQQDAGLRVIDQLSQQHPGNPEVWGQKARLLAASGQNEQAEQALQKAFDLNPNYPFGLLLQATFRYEE